MRVYKFCTQHGENIEAHQSDEGLWACPVCGLLLEGYPAWSGTIGTDGSPIEGTVALPDGGDICQCCFTHYGNSDSVSSSDGPNALARRWAELRDEWLARTPFTEEVRQQLANLEIALPAYAEVEAREITELINQGEICSIGGGHALLMRAASIGRLDMVDILLELGAEADSTTEGGRQHGWTALMFAAGRGHLPVVERLIAAGANVNHRNKRDETPLLLAAGTGQTRIVERLLAAGADPDVRDCLRWTPLELAQERGFGEIAVLLEIAGQSKSKPF